MLIKTVFQFKLDQSEEIVTGFNEICFSYIFRLCELHMDLCYQFSLPAGLCPFDMSCLALKNV